MKNSFKIAALLTAFIGTAFSSKAQTTTTTSPSSTPSNGVVYSVGVESGVSTGNFKNTYKWDIGGSIQADIPVAQQVYATVNAGYLNFFGKNNINGTGLDATDIHMIPAMAGIKFFPIPGFYIQGDAGAEFILNKSDVGLGKSSAFIYAPQIGVKLPLSGNSFIDAGVRYQASTKFTSDDDNSKINFLGIRVAYALSNK